MFFFSSLLAISQAIALVLGMVYYDQDYNQEGVMNINGALFLICTNMTFSNVFSVVNVSKNAVLLDVLTASESYALMRAVGLISGVLC